MELSVKSFSELSAEEFFRICQARDQVFVLEQKITVCAELDEADLHSIHLVLKEDGVLVAYARCYLENGAAHIGRVLTTLRGKGYGRLIMQEAVRVCRETLGSQRITLHAQEQVIPFYEKLGFRAFGDFFDECGILHRAMEL